MRCLGEFRLYLYAAWRLLCIRKYAASIYILTEDVKNSNNSKNNLSLNDYYKILKNQENNELSESNKNNFSLEKNCWEEISSNFTYFVASNISHVSTSIRCHPLATLDDGCTDLLYMSKNSGYGWCKMLSFLLGRHDDGKIFKNEVESLDNIDK